MRKTRACSQEEWAVTDQPRPPAGTVPEEAKRAFLWKVVESTTFARSEQLRRLLKWLGERALMGVNPTEYDVGTVPLRRPGDFDPQTDSLVRKEMTRLRAKLQAYYASEGRGDAVRLSSADAYRVQFQWSLPYAERPDTRAKCVMVLPPRALGVPAESLDLLYEHLLVCISGIEDIQLISPTTARFYGARPGDVRRFAVETGADFVVEGSARLSEESITVTLWAVDGRTGRSCRPFTGTNSDLQQLATQAARCLYGCLFGLTGDVLPP